MHNSEGLGFLREEKERPKLGFFPADCSNPETRAFEEKKTLHGNGNGNSRGQIHIPSLPSLGVMKLS